MGWYWGHSPRQPRCRKKPLDAVGLHVDRVIYVEAGLTATVLLSSEERLRHAGLAGIVGELSGRLALTASRRLQLAAEARPKWRS